MTHPTTSLIHHPYVPPEGFGAPQPGVFKASTVFFPNVAAMRSREWKDKSAYTYGLHGTPTTYALEERLCTLEGGLQCVLVPSGLSAVALASLALLKTGDEVLIPDNAYGPNKALAEGELKAWGISHQYYDPLDPQDLEAQISSRGVDLYELRPLQSSADARNGPGASRSRWHAKIAFVDRKTTILGSMNLDQRSATTNTEVVLLIRSPEFAARVLQYFNATRAQDVNHVHQVKLKPDGQSLQWVALKGEGQAEVLDAEPDMDYLLRLRLWLLGPFVSEDLL